MNPAYLVAGSATLLTSLALCSVGPVEALEGLPELGMRQGSSRLSADSPQIIFCQNCGISQQWQKYVYDVEDAQCFGDQPWQEETWTSTKYSCSNGYYWVCSEAITSPVSCNSTEVNGTCQPGTCAPPN
jgi:hypothetical protein